MRHLDPYWFRPEMVPAEIRADAKRALLAYEAALRPATYEQILAELATLVAVLGGKDRSSADWTFVQNVMAEDLGDVPADILHEAVAAWRRTAQFFPKPADLLALIRPMLERRRWERARILRLLGHRDGDWMVKIDRGPRRIGQAQVAHFGRADAIGKRT